MTARDEAIRAYTSGVLRARAEYALHPHSNHLPNCPCRTKRDTAARDPRTKP